MKTNAASYPIHLRPGALTRLLIVTILTAACASGLAAPASHAFEHRGAQAQLGTNPAARLQSTLPSELEMPEYSSLVRAWTTMPKTNFLVNTIRDNQSGRIAVQEVGTGSKVIVCVHGMFGEGANWKYLAGAMEGEYQLWLVDLPSFGQSDPLPAAKTDVTTYSPLALADRVLQVLDARLAARPDVMRVMIAGHSLGGMIVLRMLSDETLRQRHAGVLAKVEGLVLFAPSDVVVTQATEEWRTMLGLNGAKVNIGDGLGLIRATIEKSVRESFADPAVACRELCEQGRQVLMTGSQRRATQAMLRSAVPWLDFGRQLDWKAVKTLEAGYANVRVPCLIVWGEHDQTLPVSMGYKLTLQLPDARLVVVPESMHLLPQERPVVAAELIRSFDLQLQSGSQAAARSVENMTPETMEVLAVTQSQRTRAASTR